jgi:hypothetical protein
MSSEVVPTGSRTELNVPEAKSDLAKTIAAAVEQIRAGKSGETLEQYRERIGSIGDALDNASLSIFDRIVNPDPIDQQIRAHLHAAGRHIERGNHDKAENQLIAATQLAEANDRPTWGRWEPVLVFASEGKHALREQAQQFKDRFK